MEFLKKIKSSFNGIHWPTKKQAIIDTALTMSITAILAIMIYFWTGAIEEIVKWAINWI